MESYFESLYHIYFKNERAFIFICDMFIVQSKSQRQFSWLQFFIKNNKKINIISALDSKIGETKKIKPLYYIKYEFKKMLASLWSLCFVSLKIYWPRGCWIPTILDWQTRYFFCKEQRSYAPKAPKLYYIFDTAWQE